MCGMGRENRRAFVLGLDGATFDILLPRVERGQMPNLASLLDRAAWGDLQSTTPPFSAQAWVSMATGKNQARHGVVDFWERTPDLAPGERRNFATSRLIHGETLWQTVGRHGLRVGVVNVPVTYPPPAVNGYLVSGLLTPQGKDDFVYPPALREEILAQVPGYNPDPFDPLGASAQQLLELEDWMEKHERVSRYLMENHPGDLFFSVIQALDHLQHLFWEHITSPPGDDRLASLIDRCFRHADEIIGHRLQLLDGRTSIFLVSDHGFGPARKWFHVNRFLLERGMLALGGSEGGRLTLSLARWGLTPQRLRTLVRRVDFLGLRGRMGRLARVTLGRQLEGKLVPPIDWARTKAVSGSPATEGIFVNLKGREIGGVVEPGEAYEALRDWLIVELSALRDPETGQPVVSAVYRREEIYEGPFLDLLPDVVFDLGDEPYLASDALVASRVLEPLPRDYLQGRHRSNGVFAAAGPGIREGKRFEGARIIDVAPTLLYSLGLPIPEDMDGRPLLEIFDGEHRETHLVEYASPKLPEEPGPEPALDEKAAAEMERRLRGLGYVS
jgi:predicted AlkP superfamily phosphohydrolase/phosphomutase